MEMCTARYVTISDEIDYHLKLALPPRKLFVQSFRKDSVALLRGSMGVQSDAFILHEHGIEVDLNCGALLSSLSPQADRLGV